MAGKKNIEEQPEAVVAAETPVVVGPTDWVRVVNMTRVPINGFPLADGTTFSCLPGPDRQDRHKSRPILRKYINAAVEANIRRGLWTLERVRGDE